MRAYFACHPHLTYGPLRNGPAYAVLDRLCAVGEVNREELKALFELSNHGVLTILGNVTMALEHKDDVSRPEDGGWYADFDNPRRYVVCPGFAGAWQESGGERSSSGL